MRSWVATNLRKVISEAEIPPVTGELDKKGGTYELSDIAVGNAEVPSPGVALELTDRTARLKCEGIGMSLGPFRFAFEKNTFPKVNDEGKALISLEGVGIEVALKVTEAEGQPPQVQDLDIVVTIDDFQIEATEGHHIRLYNKVFGLVRFAVRRVVVAALNAAVNKKLRPAIEAANLLMRGSGVTRATLLEARDEVLAEVAAAKGAAQEQLEETTEAVRSEAVRVHSDMSGHVSAEARAHKAASTGVSRREPASRNFARMRSRQQQSKQRKGGGGRPLLKKGQDLAGIQTSLGLGSTPLGRGSRPKMQANPLFLQDDDEGLD